MDKLKEKIKYLIQEYTGDTREVVKGILITPKIRQAEYLKPPQINEEDDIDLVFAKMMDSLNTTYKDNSCVCINYDIEIITEPLDSMLEEE